MAMEFISSESVHNIRKLFGVKRDALCVYQVLSNCLMTRNISKPLIDEIIQRVHGYSLIDSTNSDNICKYLYIMTLQKNQQIGAAIRRSFMSGLEKLFEDRNNKSLVKTPVMYRNLVNFFMNATHFMRNPMKPPIDDLIVSILILINSLNCTECCEDLRLYSQAVAWIGSYFNHGNEKNLIWIAWREALDHLRGWISEGKGGVWSLCCLEAATNGGKISISHLPFYADTLQQYQKQAVLGISNIITLPYSCTDFFDLSNISSFIQNV